MDFRPLEMWNVYNKPLDFPESVVARKFLVAHWYAPDGFKATDDVLVGNTVDEVRALLPPGLVCVPRSEKDESQVVESWF